MKMGLLKFSKEIKDLIYAIIVLAIIFGFNDGSSSFVFSDWLKNFVSILFLSIIIMLTFFVGLKVSSRLFNYEIKFSIWRLKRYFFFKSAYINLRLGKFKITSIHFGIILALFLTLISNGVAFFTGFFTFYTKDKKKIGKFRNYLRDSTEMGITIMSVIFLLILIIIFKLIGSYDGMLISSWVLIWNLLPLGPLMGSKLFFTSRTNYFWMLVFLVLFLSLVSIIPWFLSLVIALFFSVIAMIIYFVKVEY